ncbi:MAG: U32 family peptidase C-terminal domain-containing protein [Bacillota bacterium]
MDWQDIGRVTHYYSKIAVALIELSGKLDVGDTIRIVGPKTEFEQVVKSMQVEYQGIEKAKPGDLVGLKVIDKVREGDAVFSYNPW